METLFNFAQSHPFITGWIICGLVVTAVFYWMAERSPMDTDLWPDEHVREYEE